MPSQIALHCNATTEECLAMEIVPASAAAAEAFELPDGWIVELRPRTNSSHAPDKYYHEPHTGRQFRSLPSVKRYLNGEEEPPRRRKVPILPSVIKRCLNREEEPSPRRKVPKTHHEHAMKVGTLRRIVYHGKLWTPEEFEVGVQKESLGRMSANHRALSILPDGWIVDEVPRTRAFQIDTYYIEPMTRRKFRSLPEVQRYLTADDEFAAKYKPLEMINSTEPKKPQKRISDLLSEPPERITWTLTTTSNNNSSCPEKWIAFWESFLIPDNVRDLWEETFFFGMTAGQGMDI